MAAPRRSAPTDLLGQPGDHRADVGLDVTGATLDRRIGEGVGDRSRFDGRARLCVDRDDVRLTEWANRDVIEQPLRRRLGVELLGGELCRCKRLRVPREREDVRCRVGRDIPEDVHADERAVAVVDRRDKEIRLSGIRRGQERLTDEAGDHADQRCRDDDPPAFAEDANVAGGPRLLTRCGRRDHVVPGGRVPRN